MFENATKLAQKLRLKETRQTPFAVSDPFAPESAWLAECLGHQDVPKGNLSKFASIFGIVSISAVVAAGGSCAVHMGYDWGYRLVELFFQQTTGANQGIWASQSLTFSVMPLFFGIAYGWQKSWTGAQNWTQSVLISAVSGVFLLTLVAQGINFDLSLLRMLAWSVVAIAFGMVGLWTGFKTCSALRSRVRVRALLSCGTAAIILLALGHFLGSTELPLQLEMLLYSSIIAICGAWSAMHAQARTREAAVLLAFAGTLPIMLANILNVVANLFCLAMDAMNIGPDLGWQALLSAILINAVAFGSASCGGIIGYRRAQKRLSRIEAIRP